jgi:hypothetical protein
MGPQRGQRLEEDRHINGGEDVDKAGLREQRSCPGHGFERDPQVIGLTAKAAPFRDRKEKVEARRLGSACDEQVRRVGPIVGVGLVVLIDAV